MERISNLKRLSELFKNKTLNREDGDIVLLDKGEFTLWTDKDFSFTKDCEDIAWEYMENLEIEVSGV